MSYVNILYSVVFALILVIIFACLFLEYIMIRVCLQIHEALDAGLLRCDANALLMQGSGRAVTATACGSRRVQYTGG